jgi:hypothetical protein
LLSSATPAATLFLTYVIYGISTITYARTYKDDQYQPHVFLIGLFTSIIAGLALGHEVFFQILPWCIIVCLAASSVGHTLLSTVKSKTDSNMPPEKQREV